MVYEEKFITKYNVPALKAVGWEGTFGFLTLSSLLIPFYFIPGITTFCSINRYFVWRLDFKAEFEDVTKYFSFQLVTSLAMPIPVMFLKMSMMVCSNWRIILSLREHFLLQYFQ